MKKLTLVAVLFNFLEVKIDNAVISGRCDEFEANDELARITKIKNHQRPIALRLIYLLAKLY
jgi:hypothetical protein